MMRSILFVAGDVSGDAHSALLCDEVRRRHGNWKLWAVGGVKLQAAGATLVGDTAGLGVIGFASALALLPRVLKLRARVLKFLDETRIDAVVLCDWGAFNGRLLPELKRRGVPVLYYFPPRSWQRNGDGGLQIAPLVSRVATPFEWSATRLQNAGCDAEWVGHPLLEIVNGVRRRTDRQSLRRELGATDGETLIAFLPGSRDMELKCIGPHLAGAARLLRETNANLRFAAAVPSGAGDKARRFLGEDVKVFEGRATELLLACDVAAVKSGTATLEAAVADAPQVIVYDVPPALRVQWNLTGLNRKVRFVGMPNIILERAVAPELLGDVCRAEPIARELSRLLHDGAARDAMRREYQDVRRALGEELPIGATARTADILDEMLARPPSGP